MARPCQDNDKEKYIKILEKNLHTQDRLTTVVENQTVVMKSLSDNISALNINVINNNQMLHQNISSIRNELMVWLKNVALLLFAVLLTIGGLKLTGVI
jgi:hypothetical protein